MTHRQRGVAVLVEKGVHQGVVPAQVDEGNDGHVEAGLTLHPDGRDHDKVTRDGGPIHQKVQRRLGCVEVAQVKIGVSRRARGRILFASSCRESV